MWKSGQIKLLQRVYLYFLFKKDRNIITKPVVIDLSTFLLT